MSNSPTLRLLLVDDHLIVRRGLASLLDDEEDLSVVAEAGSGEEAIALATEHKPDVIVLDLRLRDMSGIEVAAELKDQRILMLSSFMQEEDVRRAFEAGVLGYLSKDKNSDDLLTAIREVGAGRQYLPPEISLLLAKSEWSAHLTDRELEIVQWIARGRANKEIGEILTLSENTVKNHVKSILSKLNAKDRTHAVTEALKRGLFQLR
jgi:two-component system NarL family response regulator